MTVQAAEITGSTTTRHIPCTVEFAPDLRKAATDYSREVTWLHITPGTGEIRAYAGNTVYWFDCSERGGSLSEAEKEVLIGLGCFEHNAVPKKLINDRAPRRERYAVNKINGGKIKHSRCHLIKV